MINSHRGRCVKIYAHIEAQGEVYYTPLLRNVRGLTAEFRKVWHYIAMAELTHLRLGLRRVSHTVKPIQLESLLITGHLGLSKVLVAKSLSQPEPSSTYSICGGLSSSLALKFAKS